MSGSDTNDIFAPAKLVIGTLEIPIGPQEEGAEFDLRQQFVNASVGLMFALDDATDADQHKQLEAQLVIVDAIREQVPKPVQEADDASDDDDGDDGLERDEGQSMYDVLASDGQTSMFSDQEFAEATRDSEPTH